MEKVELVVTALQQRIGEIVSNYETSMAILRAEVTQLSEELEKAKSELNSKEKNKE
jgi:hypothetical protein